MPRNKLPPKNPYCVRSKFTKNEFEYIAYHYVLELTRQRSRNECIRQIQAVLKNFTITRQSLTNYYNRISKLIWDNMIIPTDPSLRNGEEIEKLRLFLYERTEKTNVNEGVIAKYFQDISTEAYDHAEPFMRSLMYHLLLTRSKKARGFSKKTFYLEFSRVFFICAVAKGKSMKFVNNDYFFDITPKNKLEKITWVTLLNILKKYPLQ